MKLEEISSSITNPPIHGRISFSQSVLADITYNLGGKYPTAKL